MRRVFGIAAVLMASTVTTALAMEPPTSSTPQATPAAQEASPATQENQSTATGSNSTSPTNAANASHVKLTAGDDEAAAQLKRFKAAGYKPEMHNGSVVFCRSEPQMGSRFERKVCTTAHLLEQQIAYAQSTMSETQRKMTSVPASPTKYN